MNEKYFLKNLTIFLIKYNFFYVHTYQKNINIYMKNMLSRYIQ